VLHLDLRALAFSSNADGTRTATVDLVGLVFDIDGEQLDTVTAGFDVRLEAAAAGRMTASGLVYTARVPIEKPGGYQLRFAVRDRRSGAIGSAGGFVTVPDVGTGTFALSGLVLQSGQRSVPGDWIDSDRFTVAPADALRIYSPGTPVSYSFAIYNPGTKVQTAASLWRGTDRLAVLPPDTLLPPSGVRAFAATGRLELPADLAAGSYVLQLAATTDDPKRPGNVRTAFQRLSFDIR
jgi:hypothetical protein